MERHKNRAFTYAIIVAIGGFIFGLDAALISGTVNFITNEFGLTDLELGTAVSAPALGVLLALPFAGYACNQFGRKRTLQIVAVLYLFSAITSALAPNYWTLVIARFIGGLAFSSISLASMYIGEIAPPKLRGKLVSMTQINIVVGLSTAYFINYIILQAVGVNGGWAESWGVTEHTWRWMLASEILPALVWLVLLFFIPESPAWLVYNSRIADAKRTLMKIIPSNEIDEYIQETLNGLGKADEKRSMWAQLREIFSRPMRNILIIATTIAIVQQSTGINAILFYAPTVFEQLGLGTDAAFAQAIWIGLTSVVFTIFAILLIDKIGRKPMIIFGMVWIIISLGMCSYGFKSARYTITKDAIAEITNVETGGKLNVLIGKEFNSDTDFKNAIKKVLGEEEARNYTSLLLEEAADLNATLILIGLLSFIAAFHFSVGPIMWVLFSEIFPISIRGVAIPFFTMITSLTNYVVQQFFPWQLATMGGSAIFLFYATTVAIGLIIIWRYLKETKNRSIEEIQLAMLKK
ncbi:MFS transporter [Maribacter sp. 6B07]|uniref:sugar porter family MFS transporter n=1 Tax=Maribacter sp. 6B07 TaxID=2045442 RepID=UPI000C08C4D0|nr:sugar porter family MFS transporter [Maribacter sp. 6B07]PHN94058.1 MFS transporter [Maribacter sp. 6B07]